MSWFERLAHLAIEGILLYVIVAQLREPAYCLYCLARQWCKQHDMA